MDVYKERNSSNKILIGDIFNEYLHVTYPVSAKMLKLCSYKMINSFIVHWSLHVCWVYCLSFCICNYLVCVMLHFFNSIICCSHFSVSLVDILQCNTHCNWHVHILYRYFIYRHPIVQYSWTYGKIQHRTNESRCVIVGYVRSYESLWNRVTVMYGFTALCISPTVCLYVQYDSGSKEWL